MAHGGSECRKTKGDLKKKRINRGYKRGGQFRTHNVDEVSEGDEKKNKKSKKKNRKY